MISNIINRIFLHLEIICTGIQTACFMLTVYIAYKHFKIAANKIEIKGQPKISVKLATKFSVKNRK